MEINFWVAVPIVALLIPITALIMDGLKNMKEKEFKHQERLKAIETGDERAIAMLTQPEIETPKPEKQKAKKSAAYHGAIWTGIGGGLLISTLMISNNGPYGSNDDIRGFANFLMLWAIPALGVGVSLVIYGALTRNGKSASSGE